MHRLKICTIVLICLMLVSTFAWADEGVGDTVVIVEGVAVGVSTSPESSVRHAALADALRRAVEKASGVLVEAEVSTNNYALTKDAVHTSSEGFVRDYRILDEGLTGGIYRMKIEAHVAPGSPIKSLKYLCGRLKETTNPLFRVSVTDETASSIISGELAALGLRVSGDSASKPDIEIKGQVKVDPMGEVIGGTDIFSANASADLTVVDSGSGLAMPSVVTTLGQPAAAVTQSQANRTAVESAAKLWVQRNLPLLIIALLDKDKVSLPEQENNRPAQKPSENVPNSEIDDAISSISGREYGSTGIGFDVVYKLARKLRDSVLEKSEFASRPVDIAVSRFKLIGIKDSQLADDILEDLSTALTKTGVFELVERSQLEKVLDELKIQNSGLIDSATAKKLGKLVGAKGVLVGSISDRKDCFVINARLINTETGRIRIAETMIIDKEPEPVVLKAGPGR